MLRKHFIRSSVDQPNYIISYTADLQVPFIGGKSKKLLTMWETGNESGPLATFEVVVDSFADGYGEWGIKTSNPSCFYGLVKDKNGYEYSMDSDNFHTITGLIFPDLDYDGNYITEIGGPLLGHGEGNSLTDVTLPFHLEYLGLDTFKGSTHLQTITIPLYVTSIGKDCFKGCTNLVDFYCDRSTPPSLNGYDIFGCYTDIPNLTIKVLYLENYLTNDEWKLYSNIIKLNPKTIGYKAANRINLKSDKWSGFSIKSHLYNSGYGVIISNNELATSVPDNAFQNITGITDIFLPESITRIGRSAFQKCTSLKNILIPKNIQVLDLTCFSYTNLSEITVPNSIIKFGVGLFVNTPLLRFIYEGTFEDWCKINFEITSSQYDSNSSNPMYYGAEKVYIDGKNIEGEVTMPAVINKQCIVNNNLIHSIVIPENTSQVQTFAICNCDSLTKVQWNAIECQISRYTTLSNNGVFSNCPNITEFIFGDSVKHIPLYVCGQCGISYITIPNSVTSIGEGAFIWCDSLTSIVIGNGVTSIGKDAFSSCSSLTDITFQGTIAQWNRVAFGSGWNTNVPATVVHCTDGDVTL